MILKKLNLKSYKLPKSRGCLHYSVILQLSGLTSMTIYYGMELPIQNEELFFMVHRVLRQDE